MSELKCIRGIELYHSDLFYLLIDHDKTIICDRISGEIKPIKSKFRLSYIIIKCVSLCNT